MNTSDKNQTKQLTENVQDSANKDVLTREDIQNGVNTIEESYQQHAPLETMAGKNNGAEPAVFKGQQKYHP